MTIGLVADVHLGGAGEGRWHNRLLYDRAEEVARAAVAALNREALEVVYVLGDITDAGTEGQLALARSILSGLRARWLVLPGNHDRAALRSGLFDAAFGEHAAPALQVHDGVAIATLREHGSVPGGGPDRYRLGDEQIASLLVGLERARPESVVFLSHQPLLAEATHAEERGGKDAGHYADGASLVERAAALVGRVAVFAAHQHWHHLVSARGWPHCVTAALVEYPMEARVVTLDASGVASRLVAVAPEAAARSLDGQAWVRGEEADREWTHRWPASSAR